MAEWQLSFVHAAMNCVFLEVFPSMRSDVQTDRFATHIAAEVGAASVIELKKKSNSFFLDMFNIFYVA